MTRQINLSNWVYSNKSKVSVLKEYKGLIVFTAILILICFLAVYLFNRKAYSPAFDLSHSQAQNIGGAIGGITTPIIGLFSSILLYLTLISQIKTNKQQELKNESDMIFLMLDQLDKEIEAFYYEYKHGEQEYKFTGLEGLNKFSRDFKHEFYGLHQKNIDSFTKVWFQSGQIIIVVDAINLIEERISISSASIQVKNLFKAKLMSVYNGKLKYALTTLSETFDKYTYLHDNETKKIQKLVQNY